MIGYDELAEFTFKQRVVSYGNSNRYEASRRKQNDEKDFRRPLSCDIFCERVGRTKTQEASFS